MCDINNKAIRTNRFLLYPLILVAFVFIVGISCSRPISEQSIFTGEEEGVTAPEILHAPNPSYTEEARVARAEGVVSLKAVIRKDGSADSFEVVRGVGYGLDESAMHTIASEWRFKPAAYKGQPVDFQADIEVSFEVY